MGAIIPQGAIGRAIVRDEERGVAVGASRAGEAFPLCAKGPGPAGELVCSELLRERGGWGRGGWVRGVGERGGVGEWEGVWVQCSNPPSLLEG